MGRAQRDALSEVALRVRDAKDSVRFGAVCRPWREAHPHRPGSLFPCLIAADQLNERPTAEHIKKKLSSVLHIRSPFSNKNLDRPRGPVLDQKKLAFSDKAKGRVFAVEVNKDDPVAALVNPITGEATAYFSLPENIINRHRPDLHNGAMFNFQVAVLLWHDEETKKEPPTVYPPNITDTHDRFAAALCASGVLRGGHTSPTVGGGNNDGKLKRKQPRWVERRRIDRNVCFFLGWESSFALDAPAREYGSSEDVIGGCAYFVARHHNWTPASMLHNVYRYSFEDGKVTVVDELPSGFNTRSMWFVPRVQPPGCAL
ncbi:hypothetical protein QOZ80_8BG0667130 [Eleusine coracana subsp. coracana]|nr:hypothetical protein QOZ80_8BG0667130 [Eleusine coracana subsp. coracana]